MAKKQTAIHGCEFEAFGEEYDYTIKRHKEMEFGTVLIVDDNFMVQKLVGDMLISGTVNCGRVLYRSNGKEGLRCIRENDIDLLIVDHNMPGMKGEELVAHVRKNPKIAATQILFMTGEQDPALAARMVYRGCQVLHKPVRSSDFLKSLYELMHEGK